MILQCNIEKTYNIPVGSRVLIYGRIGVYHASNKKGGFDYCIEEILNIEANHQPPLEVGAGD